jgi:hypothetical protein
LQQWNGFAIFCDGSDMVVRGDIEELWEMRNHRMAVQVVKHEYSTQHPLKYVGTQMQAPNYDYARKNWSSVMLVNCRHGYWREVDDVFISKRTGADLHRFDWIPDEFIGELPIEWNWLADEHGHNDAAKLLHWTAGIPAFPYYAFSPMSRDWFDAHQKVNHATP